MVRETLWRVFMIFNIFRKNKRHVFHPDNCCSGTGAAVNEFNIYKETLKKAYGREVRMVHHYSIIGMVVIIYEVLEDKEFKE